MHRFTHTQIHVYTLMHTPTHKTAHVDKYTHIHPQRHTDSRSVLPYVCGLLLSAAYLMSRQVHSTAEPTHNRLKHTQQTQTHTQNRLKTQTHTTDSHTHKQ